MVMTHEFEHAYVNKIKQKRAIEHEMEKLANYQMKNAKYNIYVTKAQAMRDQVTKDQLEHHALQDLEDEYLT